MEGNQEQDGDTEHTVKNEQGMCLIREVKEKKKKKKKKENLFVVSK